MKIFIIQGSSGYFTGANDHKGEIMKIDIDTIKDTDEEIKNMITLLENVLKTRKTSASVKQEESEGDEITHPRRKRKKDQELDEEEEVRDELRYTMFGS